MFRNIIWDVDGTLFDTYPAMTRAFQAALGDFGKTTKTSCIERRIKVSIERCTAAMAARFLLDENTLAQAFEAHYKMIKAEDQLPFPGVKAVCEAIQARGGKNVIVTHRGKTSTEALLAAHSMGGFFAGCLTGNDGYPRKPDPAAFNAALQLFNLNPAETLTVGDRDIDIQAGSSAGLLTCRFNPHNEDVVADLTVMDYEELMRFLSSEET